MKPDPVSLYLHMPFCSLKCAYCDFNSYANLDELIPPFVDALDAELGLWAPLVEGRPVSTVFLGGGTPSLLPAAAIERIVGSIRERYALTDGAEITIEANPGTVDREYLAALHTSGVNRISFGVQSLHDDELRSLDRLHTADEAVECYRWARSAGFARINLDFIYGLVEQPLERWQQTLERAINLSPDHLSLYALTVEDGTKLAYDIANGRVPEPDEDTQSAMYEWSQSRLAEAGYQQYEISNWSLPGQECRHNLVYWENGEWLGLGPGAHSHWGGYRFAVVNSPRRYIDLVQATAGSGVDHGEAPADVLRAMQQVAFVDPQPRALQVADTAILALRLNRGLDLAAFERRFGARLEDVYGPVIEEFMSAGFLERANGHLRLTDRGRYLANELFVRLLPD